MDWFLYDNGLHHERIKRVLESLIKNFLITAIETGEAKCFSKIAIRLLARKLYHLMYFVQKEPELKLGYQWDLREIIRIKSTQLFDKCQQKSKKVMFAAFSARCQGLGPQQCVEDMSLQNFSLTNLYLFDSIFSGMVWITKVHNCVEGICLLNNCPFGNEKKILFQLPQQQLYIGKNTSSKT